MSRSPRLFEPLAIGPLNLPNRIIIEPMCQYSATDGCMGPWHTIHLGHLALSGAGMLTIEATAVSPEGRLTARDVGLWNDATEAAMARTVSQIRAVSSMPLAVQLGHAGRKASTTVAWLGMDQLPPDHGDGWQTVAPSPVPFNETDVAPLELDEAAIRKTVRQFVDAAMRAARLGIDAIQLHFAHGYLAHQFLSPLSNRRTDSYGGELAGRMRFPLEVFNAVRRAVPDVALTVRISATDWVEGGWDVQQSVEFALALQARGCDAIDVSTGGAVPDASIPAGPSYQVPFAATLKQALSIPVVAVGLITAPAQAEGILACAQADAIGLARAALDDPRWPWRAASELQATVPIPRQYRLAPPMRDRHIVGPLSTS
jgi:2,4-dienoyl-CoA reductase-like NADH-dependent reductase (Old Yellow Enzyme family)